MEWPEGLCRPRDVKSKWRRTNRLSHQRDNRKRIFFFSRREAAVNSQPDIAAYIRCVRDAIAFELRPAITSSAVRETANSLVLLLGRVIADIETAPAISTEKVAAWTELAQELEHLQGLPSVAFRACSDFSEGHAFEELQHAMTRIQRRMDVFFHDDVALQTLSQTDTDASVWFGDAVGATLDFITTLERNVPVPAALTPPSGAGETGNPNGFRDSLNDYLLKRFPGFSPSGIRNFRFVPGGSSNLTAIFDVEPNDILPTRLVLRCNKSWSLTGKRVADEFILLQHLCDSGVPVPKPILAEQDTSILGGSFLIVTEIEDAGSSGDAFPELSDNYPNLGAEFGRELAQLLAGLHKAKIPAAAVGFDVAPPDPSATVRALHALWTSKDRPPLSVAADLGFAQLLSHPLPKNRPRSIVHGDINVRNLMIRDGHIAALVDWELARPGDPAEDIGYCRLMLLQHVIAWDDFVAEYVNAGGDPAACDPYAVNYYGLLAHVRNTVFASGCRTKIVTNTSRDPAIAVASWDYFHRLQWNAAHELKIAMELAKNSSINPSIQRK
jgi:aminoglycoside phosphotransferase (APT) family kinase protein